MPQGDSRKVRVWDLPTRLFHWSLAAGAVGMLVTGRIGGDALMPWHARLGYCMGALLMFRLIWGIAGGHWSRFASFPASPRAAWQHLRGSTQHAVGHNPLGALSVYAMLAFFIAQVASGLFSATKQDFAGPLSVFASDAIVHWLTAYHKRIGEPVLIALVALHLAAVAVYAWRGRNLVTPMITGDAQVEKGTLPSRDDASSRLRALAVLALCGMLIWGVVRLGG